MKAKTMAKPLKNPINLSKSPVRFTPTGSIEPVAQRGRAHPGVEGAVDIVLDEETGERCLSLQSGQAFVVPCGVWHRVMGKEPCCLLYFTPGRSRIRWKRSARSRTPN